MSLVLRVLHMSPTHFGTTKTMRFAESMTVSEALAVIHEKCGYSTSGFGLFVPVDEKAPELTIGGRWLNEKNTLEFHDLTRNQLVVCRKTSSICTVDCYGTVKTLILDVRAPSSAVVVRIAGKVGLKDSTGYGLRLASEPGKWLDLRKSFLELWNEGETVQIRKRFHLDLSPVDRDDPVGLHFQFCEMCADVLSGKLHTSQEQAVELAAIDCQVVHGTITNSSKVSVHERMAGHWHSIRGIDTLVEIEWKKLAGMNELNAKFRFVQKGCRLKNFGMTSFRVKQRVYLGKAASSKDMLLSVGARRILISEVASEETLKDHPLNSLLRYAAHADTLTLDFGKYESGFLVYETSESAEIAEEIQGYMDLVLERQRTIAAQNTDNSAESEVEMLRRQLAEERERNQNSLLRQNAEFESAGKLCNYEASNLTLLSGGGKCGVCQKKFGFTDRSLRCSRCDRRIHFKCREVDVAARHVCEVFSQNVAQSESSASSVDPARHRSRHVLANLRMFLPEDLAEGRKINSGAFGEVLMVTHRRENTSFAIKKPIKPVSGAFSDREWQSHLESLEVEAELASKLPKHGSLVEVAGYVDYGDMIGLVMELYDMSLKDLIDERVFLTEKRGGKWFSSQDIAEWSRQIACGLTYLRKHRVAHRDLKPANVLVRMHENDNGERVVGHLVLADFGISREVGKGQTETISMAGTRGYLAPEMNQGHGARYDIFRADVFSFGAVLLALLSGRVENFFAGNFKDAEGPFYRLQPDRGDSDSDPLWASLSACCLQALSRNPERRPSAFDIYRQLSLIIPEELQCKLVSLTSALPHYSLADVQISEEIESSATSRFVKCKFVRGSGSVAAILWNDEGQKQRITRAARTYHVLEAPGVANILGYFESDREFGMILPFFPMNLCTLAAKREEEVASGMLSPFSFGEVSEACRQVMCGLSYLHSQGVVHGNLHPVHILVEPKFSKTSLHRPRIALTHYWNYSNDSPLDDIKRFARVAHMLAYGSDFDAHFDVLAEIPAPRADPGANWSAWRKSAIEDCMALPPKSSHRILYGLSQVVPENSRNADIDIDINTSEDLGSDSVNIFVANDSGADQSMLQPTIEKGVQDVDQAKIAVSQGDVVLAVEQLASIRAEIEDALLAAQSGMLEPASVNPETALRNLNDTVKAMATLTKEMLTIARDSPENLGLMLIKVAAGVAQTVACAKELAATAEDPQTARAILMAAKRLVNETTRVEGAARALAAKPNDDNLNKLLSEAGREVAQSLAGLVQASRAVIPKRIQNQQQKAGENMVANSEEKEVQVYEQAIGGDEAAVDFTKTGVQAGIPKQVEDMQANLATQLDSLAEEELESDRAICKRLEKEVLRLRKENADHVLERTKLEAEVAEMRRLLVANSASVSDDNTGSSPATETKALQKQIADLKIENADLHYQLQVSRSSGAMTIADAARTQDVPLAEETRKCELRSHYLKLPTKCSVCHKIIVGFTRSQQNAEMCERSGCGQAIHTRCRAEWDQASLPPCKGGVASSQHGTRRGVSSTGGGAARTARSLTHDLP